MELGLVLDGQSGELRVGREVGSRPEVPEQTERELEVARTGPKGSNVGAIEPGLHATERYVGAATDRP